MASLQTELTLLYAAGLIYSLFGGMSLFPSLRQRYHHLLVSLVVLALAVHSTSIAVRWQRVDHGPFINLYEILTSNLWSNMLGIALFFIFLRRRTDITWFVMPIMLVMMLWLFVSPTRDTFLPPTYNTVWLYFHVVSGKFFFTLLLLSTGLACHALLLQYRGASSEDMQPYTVLAYKFLALAFVFESFMLFFGAIWAQDAWGRYWSWDPLETWAFATWLCVVFTLHMQVNAKKGTAFLWLVPACLVIAFLTFYGVPFISTAPHKGMI